jgi:hypothetical protein
MLEGLATVWIVGLAIYGSYKLLEKLYPYLQVLQWWLEDERDG